MNINVRVRQLGKKRNAVKESPFTIDGYPNTVGELIEACVFQSVSSYNQRIKDGVHPMDEIALENGEAVGKIAFGVVYSDREAVVDEAIQTAVTAFKDGLVRIFLNDVELTQIDEAISMKDGDVLTFIRLTMLAGRMW